MKLAEDRLRSIVKSVEGEMQCNCDLDNWQPERDTGHSWLCRIHKEAKRRLERNRREHRCKGCGYPVHPSCDWCGECLCEEDSL